MAVLTNMNLPSQSQVHLARSLERILEEAHLSGELNLSGRKLKDFPNSGGKYDLSDSVVVDLSKNRFIELPLEITNFWSLERLSCHHNNIKSIPDSVLFLQSLISLDLSRNHLTTLPSSLCDLPLQSLLVSHNKLTALPGELVRCSTLTELNVSCNQITHLPPSLGQLANLRSINVRNNLLLELPIELTYLRLTHLDLSCNRLASLPLEFRNMITLIDLDLNHNPLVSPPTTIAMRGRVHVFKWLELRASQGQDIGRKCVRKLSEANKYRSHRSPLTQVNSDSGYSTGLEWSTTPLPSHTLSANPSTVHLNRSDEGLNDSYKKRMERSSSEREVNYKGLNSSSSVDAGKNGVGLTNGNGVSGSGDDLVHRQTYREYKEALKQQRSQESVYKRGNSHSSNSSESSPSPSGSCTVLAPPPTQAIAQTTPISKPVQMVQPSRPVSHQNTPTEHNGHDHSPSYTKPTQNKDTPDTPYIKPSGPPPITPLNGRPPIQSWQAPPINTPPDKLNFTMRREYDKAKEEANLVNQLRQNIETRLKMSLPADLGPALSDGVVLCHLANHVKPRSVASIHVPSPAVPKLTMARCRRNVDNFLEACRKIGVDENLMCCAVDVLEARGLVGVAITVENLLKFHKPMVQRVHLPPGVNAYIQG